MLILVAGKYSTFRSKAVDGVFKSRIFSVNDHCYHKCNTVFCYLCCTEWALMELAAAAIMPLDLIQSVRFMALILHPYNYVSSCCYYYSTNTTTITIITVFS